MLPSQRAAAKRENTSNVGAYNNNQNQQRKMYELPNLRCIDTWYLRAQSSVLGAQPRVQLGRPWDDP